jgi:hypothetical protein
MGSGLLTSKEIASGKRGDARIFLGDGGGGGGEYSFPEIDATKTVQKTKVLHMLLDKTIHENSDYFKIRVQYCRIQIELNTRVRENPADIKCPKFRAKRKLPYAFSGYDYEIADSYLSNDTQIIAMHWHYCRGRRLAIEKFAKNVYSGEVFDYKAAANFVVTGGYATKKVKMIGLDLDERWESGSFDDEKMREQLKSIEAYVIKARSRLKHLSRRNPQIKNSINVWCDLLKSMLIEVICGGSKDDLSPNQVAKKYQVITGEKISRQAARAKMKSIFKHLPDCLEAL